MTDGNLVNPVISKEILWEDYYSNLKGALASMRRIFRLRSERGLTQDQIASKLRVDKSLVSRRLRGEENFTLKTLSFMASAMKCRLDIRFKPYEELGEGNNYSLEQDYDQHVGSALSQSSGALGTQFQRPQPQGIPQAVR